MKSWEECQATLLHNSISYSITVSQFYIRTSYSGDTFVYLISPSYSLGSDNGSILETETIMNTFTSNLGNLLNLADRKEKKKDRIVSHQYLL